MEPLILLGREVLARRTPWRLAVVAGTTVRPEEHGFPELKGVTLTDHSSAQEPDGPTVATYADPSVRLTEENLFAVGKQRFEVFAYRAWVGRPSRPLSPGVLAALRAVRAADSTQKRLVLADVLEEEGATAEAEYVRREIALVTVYDSKGPGVLAQLKAFNALAAVVGTTFRVLVARDVDGCAGPSKWTFRCPRQWHELPKTDDPRLAFCDRCVKPVAIAATEEEAEALAADAVCVSYTDYGFHPEGPYDGE